MGSNKVFGCGGVLGNSDINDWLLPSYTHSPVIFFLFVKAAKELRPESEKKQEYL